MAIDALSTACGLRFANQFGRFTGWAELAVSPRGDAYVVKNIDPKWLYHHRERDALFMSEAEAWQLLVMIDTCMEIGLCIWDAGYLQILIEQYRLRKADFSNSYAAVDRS